MPYCTNCGKSQSKLNGGTLCKVCFNTSNKGIVRSKESTSNLPHSPSPTNNLNNPSSMNGDVMEQQLSDMDISQLKDNCTINQ